MMNANIVCEPLYVNLNTIVLFNLTNNSITIYKIMKDNKTSNSLYFIA